MHKANDDQVDDHYSDEEAFYSHIESNEPSREDIDLPHGSREDIDLPHGSQESKPNRDHRISLLRRKKRDGLRGRIFSRDEYSRQLPDSSDRQENEIKDPENKVHPLRKEVLECFSNLDEELSCSEVKVDLSNAPINVKPGGGGGRATHGNLTLAYIPRVGILIGHHAFDLSILYSRRESKPFVSANFDNIFFARGWGFW